MPKKKVRNLLPEDTVDKELICNAAMTFINAVGTENRTLRDCYLKLEELSYTTSEAYVDQLAVITKSDTGPTIAFLFDNFMVPRIK